MLDIERALTSKYPRFFNEHASITSRLVIRSMRALFAENKINNFLQEHEGLEGTDFIEKVMEYFDFSYTVSNTDKENIPATGAVVIVANHPLGALDALSLIMLVSEVRSDIRVVGNDLLDNIPPMRSLLLPINNLDGSPGKNNIRNIQEALRQQQAVIMFPSGEVSRARLNGVRDTRWHSGFLRFASKTEAPILPVYMHARNSMMFYAASSVWKPLGSLLLVQEMLRQHAKTMTIRVGRMIPYQHINSRLTTRAQVKLVKKHLYRVGNKRSGLIKTVSPIAHPESSRQLKEELSRSSLLGTTSDGKRIYLFDYIPDSAVIREIGRLREVTFRRVGEGTGRRRDKDRYDQYYRHIVLWDDERLELVGAYRIGEGRMIRQQRGSEGFYTNTLFRFDAEFDEYLDDAIELGRSFVQPAFWGSRALDYLWQGIGAYLLRHPGVRWMYGPVSISNSYPKGARDLMVFFYRKYFSNGENLAQARKPYVLTDDENTEFAQIFDAGNYRDDFRALKEMLTHYSVSVPTLFKQYSELCEDGGSTFLDFNVDPDFGHCIDGLVLVDVSRIKASKWKRYVGSVETQAA